MGVVTQCLVQDIDTIVHGSDPSDEMHSHVVASWGPVNVTSRSPQRTEDIPVLLLNMDLVEHSLSVNHQCHWVGRSESGLPPAC